MKACSFLSSFLLLGLLATAPALAQTSGKHAMGGHFEPGPADGALTFVFHLIPTPVSAPKVRWLGATAHDDARVLTVQNDGRGGFSAILAPVPPGGEGRVLVELSEPGAGAFELHSAEFALREPVGARPASRPSRDGHFVVFTKPDGPSAGPRLLIGSGADSVEDLPASLTHRVVSAVYTLDVLPASAAVSGWMLTAAIAPTDTNPVLYYLAKGGTAWQALDSPAIKERQLIAASVAGPGTYVVTREVRP